MSEIEKDTHAVFHGGLEVPTMQMSPRHLQKDPSVLEKAIPPPAMQKIPSTSETPAQPAPASTAVPTATG